MEIEEFQHENSIWTWKSSARRAKATLWLPYLRDIEKVKEWVYRFTYNGGEVTADLAKLDCIMLYGATGTLDVEFLDKLSVSRVPLLIHRRNMQQPMMFMPALRPDAKDVLGRQVIFRGNEIKASYIARSLVWARFTGAEMPPGAGDTVRLKRARTIAAVRTVESELSRRYWRQFFARIGAADGLRREKSPVAAALDAGSFFMSGIILRWILVHRLSPAHGFLHINTAYPSLVYDLMEPYRYIIENAVAAAAQKYGADSERLTAATIARMKDAMEDNVYVPMTRQNVRRKNLLHGGVLALRAYLAGEMKRLVIPMEGRKNGGRPPKVSYKMPGGRR